MYISQKIIIGSVQFFVPQLFFVGFYKCRKYLFSNTEKLEQKELSYNIQACSRHKELSKIMGIKAAWENKSSCL